MKERPILMSTPMVRAILDGTKTQTRRIVKPTMTTPRVAPLTMEPWLIDGEQEIDDQGLPCWVGTHPDYPTGEKWFSCPYGGAGDRLWVRETWRQETFPASGSPPLTHYRADDTAEHRAWSIARMWRPSIHMPRRASRLTLEIIEVRVQRLQDISEADCCHELGAPLTWQGDGPEPYRRDLRGVFANLWDELYAARGYSWESNPWVWAISYRRVPQTERNGQQ